MMVLKSRNLSPVLYFIARKRTGDLKSQLKRELTLCLNI